MTIFFERPAGAPSDVSEVEYISALLQTSPHSLRHDATLTATDIRLYLKSRHGIRVKREQITRMIMSELGGTNLKFPYERSDLGIGSERVGNGDDDEDDEEQDKNNQAYVDLKDKRLPKLDMVQFLAVLLIPRLRALQDELAGELDGVPLGSNEEIIDVESGRKEQAIHTESARKELDERQLEKIESETAPQTPGEEQKLESTELTELVQAESSTNTQAQVGGKELETIGQEQEDAETSKETPVGEEPEAIEYTFEQAQSATENGNEAISSKDVRNGRVQFNLPDERTDEQTTKARIRCLAGDSDELVDTVLRIILHESKLEYGSELTREGIKKILMTFRENWSDETVDLMLAACRPIDGDSNAPVFLDGETMLRAMTADVALYDTSKLTSPSTHYEDALANDGAGSLSRFYTAPNIDRFADTHRSFTWSVLAWFTLTFTFFAYFFEGYEPHNGFPETPCASLSTFGCEVARSIVLWLEVFVKLSILGSLFLFLSTLGNSVFLFTERLVTGAFWTIIGIVAVVLYCILSYATTVINPFFETEIDDENRIQASLALIFGILLVLTQIGQLINLFLYAMKSGGVNNSHSIFVPGSVRLERNLKLSAKFKVSRLIENALACHTDSGSGKAKSVRLMTVGLPEEVSGISEAMIRYQRTMPTEREAVASIFWTWRKIVNGTLCQEEGIWFFPRLVSANIVQWVVVLVFILLAIVGNDLIDENYNNIPNVKSIATKTEMKFAFSVGAAPAILGAISVAVSYIPSAVSTQLKFRSGFHGSLADRRFLQNRYALDQTNTLFGAAFWAALFSGLLFWVVVGAIAFTWVWDNPRYRPTIDLIYANIIGVAVTMAVKTIIMQLFRINWFGAFMRRRPAAVNILFAVQEAWNLGLSTWIIAIRGIKLLVVTLFFIGRVDTPLLAPGVDWVFDRFPLDGLPTAFLQDLLIHEAHRHPYVERVGYLYLLKLRHGSNFGRQECAAWRILFVLALMPWMRRYRVQSYETVRDPDDILGMVLTEVAKKLQQAVPSVDHERLLADVGIQFAVPKVDNLLKTNTFPNVKVERLSGMFRTSRTQKVVSEEEQEEFNVTAIARTTNKGTTDEAALLLADVTPATRGESHLTEEEAQPSHAALENDGTVSATKDAEESIEDEPAHVANDDKRVIDSASLLPTGKTNTTTTDHASTDAPDEPLLVATVLHQKGSEDSMEVHV